MRPPSAGLTSRRASLNSRTSGVAASGIGVSAPRRARPRSPRRPPRRAGTAGRSGRSRGGSGPARRTGRARGRRRRSAPVRPVSARSAATRATPGPHIIPWPPAEATVTPSIATAVDGQGRPEDRQVVGRVVDRRRPDLAQPEVARDRHEAREPRSGRLVHRPVDRAGLARRLVRVAPAEQQPALLEPPVQARRRCRTPSACRSTSNAACGSRTATVWRTAPAGIRMPAARRRRAATARRSGARARSRSGPRSSRRRRRAGRRPSSGREKAE